MMNDYFITIDNGKLSIYQLNDKLIWELGRISKGNIPDIRMTPTTISRKHGRLENEEGVWFYIDNNGTNGTVYNGRHIEAEVNGRCRSIMMSDGDILIFGGSNEPRINNRTVFGLYVEAEYDSEWSVVNTHGMKRINARCGKQTMELINPDIGKVFTNEEGTLIYMGDMTYLLGDSDITDAERL